MLGILGQGGDVIWGNLRALGGIVGRLLLCRRDRGNRHRSIVCQEVPFWTLPIRLANLLVGYLPLAKQACWV